MSQKVKGGPVETPLFGELPATLPPEPPQRALTKPIWTENKARLIAAYLKYFTFITKHGANIDGFAGPQNPADEGSWSARLVLNNQPAWLRQFVLCDVMKRQVKRLEKLKAEQPYVKNRSVDIIEGDFNKSVEEALRLAKVKSKTATFCVLDQRTFECEWQTVKTLAAHKPLDQNKIELFYFLPIGWFDRAIAALKRKSVVDRWWGGEDWQAYAKAKAQQRSEMFVARMRAELGYSSVRAYPIHDSEFGKRLMYYMVHATDHPEAPALMRRAYEVATSSPVRAEQLELSIISELQTRATPDSSADDGRKA